MNNEVIEVLNEEHGKEVRKYFESKGVNLSGWGFIHTRDSKEELRYYGFVDGRFGSWRLNTVKEHNTQIIEIPNPEIEPPKVTEELPIPRFVAVRDSDQREWERRELLADLSEYGIKSPFMCRDENYRNNIRMWGYMKELPTEEITKEEAEKLLSELKNVEIKIK